MKLPKFSPKLRKPEVEDLRVSLRKLKNAKPPLLFRRVVGQSMLPVLPPGTFVIGWRYFKDLNPGHIVVLNHDGREKIKRLSEIKDKQIYLLGDKAEESTDSRHFGWLDYDSVKAIVIWPRDKTDKSY